MKKACKKVLAVFMAFMMLVPSLAILEGTDVSQSISALAASSTTTSAKVKVAKPKKFKVTAKKTKSLDVSFKKVSKADGYVIYYSTSKKFTKKTTKKITVKVTKKLAKKKTITKRISKLKNNKTYYVKVRAYRTVNKKKVYSKYTKVKKVKTLKKASATVATTAQTQETTTAQSEQTTVPASQTTTTTTAPAATVYTVTFESNGGTTVASQQVEEGNTATQPTDPTKEGYRFVAWYTDSDLTSVYNFNSSVNSNITLYAKWEAISTEEPGLLDEANDDVEINSFSADTMDILIGEEATVTFTAEIFAEIELEAEDVYVKDGNNTVIGYMNDDGTDGDETADDGIYTLVTTCSSDTQEIISYYAVAKDVTSDSFNINYYHEIEESEIETADEIADSLTSSLDSYINEDGTTSESDVESASALLTENLDQLVQDGTISSYEDNTTNVVVTLPTGYSFVYSLSVEDCSSGGSISTFQPYKNTASSTLNELSDKATDSSAELITQEFSGYTFSDSSNIDLDNVTLDELKNISDYSVILWDGHGGYSETYGSMLGIGELKNPSTTSLYSADIDAGRIFTVYAAGRTTYAVTGGFFDKYLESSSLNGAFIYLSTCDSGKDMYSNTCKYSLVKSFTNKGASAVFANSDTIHTEYTENMMRAIIEYMCEIDNDSIYNTAADALEYAKSIYGENDSLWFSEGITGRWHITTEVSLYPLNNSIASNYRFDNSGTGIISGSVKSASSSADISNAFVRVYDTDNNLISTSRTDSSGAYSLSVKAGEYIVKISAGSYKSAKMAVTVTEGETTFNETFLLVNAGSYMNYASGTITDSVTGSPVAGVTVNVRLNWSNDSGTIIYTTTTDSDGYYQVYYDTGLYTIEYYKSGYNTGYKNIVISDGSVSQDAVISPVTSSGVYRIVLTWGEYPSDLDSHVYGTLSSGSSFHTYYSNKSSYDGEIEVCNLDVDDVTSYGPETITLIPTVSSPYYYYIYNYSGNYSSTIGNSGAQIKVYDGSTLIRTFNVPTDQGDGRYWNVFAIVDGNIVVSNTITDSANTSYAG